jgi:hypothetical protein
MQRSEEKMRPLTIDSQRHREIENQQDPATAAIIGFAVEEHRQLGPGDASITKKLILKQTG